MREFRQGFIRTQHERVKTSNGFPCFLSEWGQAGPSSGVRVRAEPLSWARGGLGESLPSPWWCCVQGSCLSTSL